MILNANLIAQHVIQNKNGTIKQGIVNVDVIISAKKVLVRILADVFVRIVSI